METQARPVGTHPAGTHPHHQSTSSTHIPTYVMVIAGHVVVLALVVVYYLMKKPKYVLQDGTSWWDAGAPSFSAPCPGTLDTSGTYCVLDREDAEKLCNKHDSCIGYVANSGLNAWDAYPKNAVALVGQVNVNKNIPVSTSMFFKKM